MITHIVMTFFQVFVTCNFEVQNTLSTSIFRAYSNDMCILWSFWVLQISHWCLHRNVNAVLIGLFLEISLVAFLAHVVVMRRLLRMQVFCHHWLISSSQQCTVCGPNCGQCTTCVLCGCCLSQFQICVCVSRLVSLLSVIKFSLHQSASIVTKSLSSPAGASFSWEKNSNSCVFRHWTACTETQQRF